EPRTSGQWEEAQQAADPPDADDDPDAAPANAVAERQGEQRRDRPHARAADEVHDRKDAAADELGRVLARVGERERLLGAEADPGDEAGDPEPEHRRRQRAEDGEDSEQQEVE